MKQRKKKTEKHKDKMLKNNILYNRKWYCSLLFLFLLFSLQKLSAEDVKFSASAPKAIENGKEFQVVYEINQEGSDLKIPELKDFEFLGGPSTSQQSSFSVVNGKTTQSFLISYSLFFRAVKEGVFTIPPATIKVDKKTYQSNELTIEVVKSSTNINPQQPAQQNNQQNVANNEALFLRIFTDKKDAYIGEQIVATVKLYSRYNIENYGLTKMPTFQGFFKQDIETVVKGEEEYINGQKYLSVVFLRFILFPQQSGKLNIDPVSFDLILNRPSKSFFGFPERFKQSVTSNNLVINVKPLPENKPADFKGAVGSFTLTGSVNKTEAKTNDAITFKVTLKGKGNIKLIETPKLKLPPDFEIYEPKISSNISNTLAGQNGSTTFEYLAIPRYAGEYKVEPITLTYFDPDARLYKTLSTPSFNLTIQKGDDTITAPVVVGLTKEDIKFLGKDIRFIKTKSKLSTVGGYLFGTLSFYLIYPFLLLLMTAIILIRRKQIKQNKNIWLVKNKKANKLAGKRLRLAHSYLKENNNEKFYEEMARALWGYISDKLSIPFSNLSKDKAGELLASHSLNRELIDSLMQIIDECEFARYAPPSEALAMKEQYMKAVNIISEIEQKIR